MNETQSAPAPANFQLRCEFCLERVAVPAGVRELPHPCAGCGRPIRIDRPRKVAAEDFEASVIGSPLPVIVDFFADWCGPCKWLTPTLDEVAGAAAGRLLVAKVDVDQAPELAERYRIGSVPTVLLIRGGEEIERSIGVEPERVRAMAGLPSD